MISLTCPFEGGSDTKSIELKNPDLSDHTKIETPVTFKMSMSGKLYGKSTTPRPTILVWTFSSLARLKARELEDFMEFSAGKFMRLLDSDFASWKVKFLTTTPSFISTGRGNSAGVPESASVTIELEGEKL